MSAMSSHLAFHHRSVTPRLVHVDVGVRPRRRENALSQVLSPPLGTRCTAPACAAASGSMGLGAHEEVGGRPDLSSRRRPGPLQRAAAESGHRELQGRHATDASHADHLPAAQPLLGGPLPGRRRCGLQTSEAFPAPPARVDAVRTRRDGRSPHARAPGRQVRLRLLLRFQHSPWWVRAKATGDPVPARS